MAIAGLGAGPALAAADAAPAAADDPWPELRTLLFADRPIQDGAGVIALEAPARAYDAAVVPLTITALMPQTPGRYIQTLHLLIDHNPAPIAGVFHLTPENGIATIATRVRINEYTDVRVIAETSDGQLYMASRFVKAAGGCSAPALKDREAALARLGQMRLKHGAVRLGEPTQVQLLISHPNYTGLQIDQLSRNWIPPHYVQTIEARFAGRPVLAVDADISLSENPSIHFRSCRPAGHARGRGQGQRGPDLQRELAGRGRHLVLTPGSSMFESAALRHVIDKDLYRAEEPRLRQALLDAQFDLLERKKLPGHHPDRRRRRRRQGRGDQLLNEWMDPRHLQTHAFGTPTDEERRAAADVALLARAAAQGRDRRSSSAPGTPSRSWTASLGEIDEAELRARRSSGSTASSRCSRRGRADPQVLVSTSPRRAEEAPEEAGEGSRHPLARHARTGERRALRRVRPVGGDGLRATSTAWRRGSWSRAPIDRYRDLTVGQTILASLQQAAGRAGAGPRPTAVPPLIAAASTVATCSTRST